mgnify:CR=1 FL=1
MAGVGPRLELRQGQSLVMTPQLQQAIKLLPMSTLELSDLLNQLKLLQEEVKKLKH